VRDPGEQASLAGLAQLAQDPEVTWLCLALRVWAAQQEGETGAVLLADQETRSRLRALGYVE
jgi:hypothetical protein